MKLKDITQVAISVALLIIFSWTSIPGVVPFSLQNLGIFLLLFVFGGRKSTLTIAIYLLMGLIGLPVFASFKGGIAVFAGPTGGYLISFLLISFLYWIIEKKIEEKPLWIFVTAILLMLMSYALGSLWMVVFYENVKDFNSFLVTFGTTTLTFGLFDLVKISLAYILSKRIRPLILK